MLDRDHCRRRRRLTIALTTLAVVTAACADVAPLLQGGVGVTESEAFPLQSGTYVIAWTASPQTVAGCELEIDVLSEADDVRARVDEAFDSGGGRQDVEPAGELASGDYRLRVTTTCEVWTARVGIEARTE